MAFFGNLLGSGKLFSDRMRYVNDFRIEEYRDARGKMRKKAVYTGPWTVLCEPGRGTLAKLIGAAALSVLSAVTLINALLLTHAVSGNLFVMIPLYLALFPMFYLLMGAASLPYRRKPMHRDQYMHGVTRMQRSSVAIIVFVAVGMIASLICRAVIRDWLYWKEDIWFLIGCGISAVFCAGILFLLGRIDTKECPNETYPNA